MLSYWIWLAAFIFAPLIALAIWKREKLARYWKTPLLCGLGAIAFAYSWDAFAIRNGLWGFPQQEILGVWLLSLPLEEWVFIFSVSALVSIAVLAFSGVGDD